MQRLASHVVSIPETTSPTPALLVAMHVLRCVEPIVCCPVVVVAPKPARLHPPAVLTADRSAAVGGVSAIITLTL